MDQKQALFTQICGSNTEFCLHKSVDQIKALLTRRPAMLLFTSFEGKVLNSYKTVLKKHQLTEHIKVNLNNFRAVFPDE